jgi:D-amino-acid dehydrogenase
MAKRLLIIGGGVIGLCAAYYSSLNGHRVTVVERGDEEHDGCSFGNAGMIVPSHFVPLAAPGMVALGLKWMWNPESPFYIKPRIDADLFKWGWNFWRASNAECVRRAAPVLRDLHLASRSCFEEFLKTGAEFGLVQKGLVMLCKSAHTLDEEGQMAEKARELGVPAEVLDRQATAKLDPAVEMDVAGSVYFPRDCHLSPSHFMAMLKALVVKQGVEFLWNTDVTDWMLAHDRIAAVKTSRGDLTADEYILCGGVWSANLAAAGGLNVPMQAGKGYSVTLARPRQLPSICSILTEARVAITPMLGMLRCGGTMEMAGINEDINRVRVQGITRAVMQYYPAFKPADFDGLPVWRGLRPCSPDGLPYLGRPRRRSNLVIATGHAMMGLSLGPVTGKLVAQIVSDEKPFIDLTLLRPDRYD